MYSCNLQDISSEWVLITSQALSIERLIFGAPYKLVVVKHVEKYKSIDNYAKHGSYKKADTTYEDILADFLIDRFQSRRPSPPPGFHSYQWSPTGVQASQVHVIISARSERSHGKFGDYMVGTWRQQKQGSIPSFYASSL